MMKADRQRRLTIFKEATRLRTEFLKEAMVYKIKWHL